MNNQFSFCFSGSLSNGHESGKAEQPTIKKLSAAESRERREKEGAERAERERRDIAAGRQIGYQKNTDQFLVQFGVGIKDPQFGDILAAIKSLPQRRYTGAAWAAGATQSNGARIEQIAARFSFTVSGGAAERLAELRSAEPEPPKKAFLGSVKIDSKGSSLEISIPFENPDFTKIKDGIKALPVRRFDGDRKLWVVPINAIGRVLGICAGFELGEGVAARLAETETISAPAGPNADPEAFAEELLSKIDLDAHFGADGRTLRLHQQAGIIKMLAQRGTILADDMGLGKTMTALVAALAWQRLGAQIIVVCPASLRLNWEREAEMCGVSIKAYSWAKMPESIAGDYVLIADEAHYAQSLKSKRTKALLALADGAQAVFLLTGTPIKNGRPSNLYPLLAAVQHSIAYPIRQRHQGYVMRYCYRRNKFTPLGYDDQGAQNLDELHHLTKDLMLRRLKKDCLDLPAKTRVIRKVEFSAKAQEIYNSRLHALRSDYEARIQQGKIQRNDAIVLLGQLRQAGSIAKTETAIELSQEIIEQGGQVVIFCEYKESTHIIADALKDHGVGFITGNVSDAQVERDKAAFQAGSLKVLLCTFKRGGVGHTLTAASNVILVDRAWTPGDVVQAEDRLHRIGQHWPVTCHWLQANGTDEAIDELLVSKQDRIDLIMQGKRKTLRGVDGSVLEAAEEILSAIFG